MITSSPRNLNTNAEITGQAKIAQALGLTSSTLTIELKDPTSRLYVDELLTISSLLKIDYQEFIAVG